MALVGSSGCGKSTIVSLIQRYYDPIDGNVVCSCKYLFKKKILGNILVVMTWYFEAIIRNNWRHTLKELIFS